MRNLVVAGLFASFTLAAINASAAPFGPASITVNGNVYSNFDVVLNGGGNPQSAADISVTANAFGDGIAITSGFAASPTNFRDAAVTFNVDSANGISGANLNIQAGTFLGFAVASVSETIFNRDNNTGLANLLAYCTTTSCSPADETDPDSGYKSLGGSFTHLLVQKDISVQGFGGYATLSVVNEGFNGGGTPVPEPASIALLGLGLVGIAGARKLNKRG